MGTDTAAAETGGAQAPHQLASVDGDRSRCEGLLAQFLGHVIVIAVKRARGKAQAGREGMQLVVTQIADEMRPPSAAERPYGRIDEDRH